MISRIYSLVVVAVMAVACDTQLEEPATDIDGSKRAIPLATDNDQQVSEDFGAITFIGTVKEATLLPEDLIYGDYPDVLSAFVVAPVVPLPAWVNGDPVLIYARVLKDRETTESTPIKTGDTVYVEMESMEKTSSETQSLQRLNSIERSFDQIFFASDFEYRGRSSVENEADVDSAVESSELNFSSEPRMAIYRESNHKQEAIESTAILLDDELEANGDGSYQLWFDRLDDFRDAVQQKRNYEWIDPSELGRPGRVHQWHTDATQILASSIRSYLNPEDEGVSSAEQLIAIADQLAQRNIDFIYVPIPSKLEIFPDKFAPMSSFEVGAISPAKVELLQRLSDARIEVIFLDPAFRLFREKHPELPLFMPGKDSHFSSFGAKIAGVAIGERLVGREYLELGNSTEEFEVRSQDYRWGEEFGWKELVPVTAERIFDNRTMDFFASDLDSPVLMMGDSNLSWWQDRMGYNAGVAAHCSNVLGDAIDFEYINAFHLRSIEEFPPTRFEMKRVLVLVQSATSLYSPNGNARLPRLRN